MRQSFYSFLGLVLTVLTASAVDRFVATNGLHDVVGGFINWDGAATNIQAAVNVAEPGETVWVSEGIYTTAEGEVAGNVHNVVVMTNGITLKSQSGPEKTIIDAGGETAAFPHRGVYMYNSKLDGFTVRNGYVIGNTSTYGAGIQCTVSNNIVMNCIIYNNRLKSGHSGGGIGLTWSKDSLIDNCLVYSNRTYLQGGGIFILYANPEVTNCEIFDNRAEDGWLLQGGGIYINQAASLIRNCLISGNYAKNGGGGIYMRGTTTLASHWVTIENCTITDNLTDGDGGGIFAEASSTFRAYSVKNSVIVNNEATGAYPDVYSYLANPPANYLISSCCLGDTNGISAGNADMDSCFMADPLFINSGQRNYRLRSNSPCMNAGVNQDWMDDWFDLDGRPRLIDDQVDLGVYEMLYFPGTVMFIR